MTRLECVPSDALAGDAAWWRIYEESFASAAREPAEVILRSVREGVGLALRAADASGTTIALATTHLLKRPAAVFLVYLAVAITVISGLDYFFGVRRRIEEERRRRAASRGTRERVAGGA